MKAVVGLLVLVFVVAVSALAPLQALPPRGQYVPDEYIVVLKDGASVETRDLHLKNLQADFAISRGVNEILTTYHIGDFVGYHAKLSQDMLARARADPDVQYIEYNQIAQASGDTCKVQKGAPWGLDRINQVALVLDDTYNYGADGTNVDAYIIDTGIQVTHKDFAGRASWGKDFTTDNPRETDCNGHGTHVAGTVGGTVYGVAKGANLIAVKVLNCQGSGTYDAVIAGINWVADQGKSTMAAKGKRSVANMSLGGGASDAVNAAVKNAVSAGVVFVVAAGNSNADACKFSPASAPSAITVGATELGNRNSKQEDVRSYFSNYGTCVDIFAPGTGITSAWIGADDAERTISGTSMASPHVAGAVAVLLSAKPDLPTADVESAIAAASTKNVIIDPGTGSPNAILYTHCAE